MQKRIGMFDIAKAVALIGVVVGHTLFLGMPQSIVDFCFSFDMPLFFIVSGYFCKKESLKREVVIKNARSLLSPYALTCLLVIAGMTVRAMLNSDNIAITAFDWIVASLYGSGDYLPGMPDGVPAIGAIWYLLALFWSKLLLSAANDSKYPLPICIALFVAGIATAERVWLPLSIQPAFCSTLFLYIGQVIRQRKLLDSGSIHPIIWACMLFTFLYCGFFYGQLYMVRNEYRHVLMDVIGGFCGTMVILKSGEFISKNMRIIAEPLELIGRNTLPLFCMHLLIINVVDWSYVSTFTQNISVSTPIAAVLINFTLMALLSLLIYVLPTPISSCFFKKKCRLSMQNSNQE